MQRRQPSGKPQRKQPPEYQKHPHHHHHSQQQQHHHQQQDQPIQRQITHQEIETISHELNLNPYHLRVFAPHLSITELPAPPPPEVAVREEVKALHEFLFAELEKKRSVPQPSESEQPLPLPSTRSAQPADQEEVASSLSQLHLQDISTNNNNDFDEVASFLQANLRDDTAIGSSSASSSTSLFASSTIHSYSNYNQNNNNTNSIMPKEPKKKVSATIGHSTRHAPLGQVIQDDVNRGKYATRKVSVGGKKKHDDFDEGESELLDERTSQKILDMSRDQQREMQEEEEEMQRRRKQSKKIQSQQGKKKQQGLPPRGKNDSSDEESNASENEEEYEEEEILVEHDEGYVTMSDNIGLTAEEEALLSNMMGGSKGNEMEGEEMPERRNLADLIMAKIEEKEAMAHANASGGGGGEGGEEEEVGMDLPPKVVQVYTDIGKLLTHYTSGKLPKAFKVIPSLHNWEEVLYLTRPDLWTPQAMYAATRIFASNLNPKMAQRFYNLVLLDAVRADVYANKKLNYHYYMALKKSVYKPAAFFKGILLPLCKEGCTLREAVIVASVLQRVSIPVHHSAVAIHKLALMTEYNGAASIFIKTLLNKKYSLPAPVIGSLITHFVRFKDDPEAELPVLWHQALLVFVQRYKNEVGVEGKEQLRDLMKVHSHPKITVEVRRELFGSAAWREERGGGEVGGGRGDAMMM